MRQNLTTLICVISVAISLLCAATKTQADESIGLDISATWVSQYIWRGIDQLDDDGAIQPSITYSLGDSGLSFNVWGSYSLGNSDDLHEVDYTADYTVPITDSIEFSAGAIYYWLENDSNTIDLYVAATLIDAMFTPSLAVYGDIDEAEGIYANLSGTQEISITENMAVSLGAAIGFWFGYADIEDGFGDLDLSASTSFDLGGGVVVSPKVQYIIVDDDSVNTEDEFVASVEVGIGL